MKAPPLPAVLLWPFLWWSAPMAMVQAADTFGCSSTCTGTTMTSTKTVTSFSALQTALSDAESTCIELGANIEFTNAGIDVQSSSPCYSKIIHGMGYELTSNRNGVYYMFEVRQHCDLTLSHVAMTGGGSEYWGRAIQVYGDLSLYCSTFLNFYYEDSGSIVYVGRTGRLMKSSGNTFGNSFSSSSGAAIFTGQNETLTSEVS